MSDPNFGPVAGYALFFLIRALYQGSRQPKPTLSPTVTPPPRSPSPVSPVAPVAESRATLPRAWPIPPGLDLVVPVERWRRNGELLAWRFWGLGRHPGDGGLRLVSFRAPWAWDGPVLRAHRLPSESPFSSAGVYALKKPPPHTADVHWSDECWVSGWVALSGRVVEHEHGYRAERVVIRRLRLGLGTHLRLPRVEDIIALAAELERRYQAPVNLGMVERRFAQRVLQARQEHWQEGIPEIRSGVRVG